MLEEYSNFCYNQVGNYALDYLEYFQALRPQLAKADIEISLPEYVSMTVFSTLASVMITVPLFITVLVILSGVSGVFLGLFLALLTSVGVMASFYIYPSIIIQSRASEMRDMLPFASMYMTTLAGTGTPIGELFANLAETEEYGEISKEAEKIHRDIDTFGLDVSEALKRATERTPSKDFEELLWGINHSMSSGGSLRSFLHERSETLMNDYQRRVESFSEQLSLLVELYITLVIVGSIVFTSMSVVMTSFTGYGPETIVLIQMAAIFVGLPVISYMFILIVQSMTPGGIR